MAAAAKKSKLTIVCNKPSPKVLVGLVKYVLYTNKTIKMYTKAIKPGPISIEPIKDPP